MASTNFIQRSQSFIYDGGNCLRTDYKHNSCQLCVELCPEDAIALNRHKIVLDDERCTQCAACIGICPSEALSDESFNVNLFSEQFHEHATTILSCKENTACLSAFDSYHYLTMALRSEEAVVCQLGDCDVCEMNREGKLKESIEARIEASNAFLEQIGAKTRIIASKEPSGKKSFFKRIFEIEEKRNRTEESLLYGQDNILKNRVPVKRELFYQTLKETIEQFETTAFNELTPLFDNKSITFSDCTLCNECVSFCPTGALFNSSDKQGIYFQANRCIGCGICEHICKEDAIASTEQFDLVALAFGRAQELVHYEMALCMECKTAYPYKGGEQICDRCAAVKEDMDWMMQMAKDM